MTWLQQHIAGLICHFTTHEVDWVYYAMVNTRRCIHCETPMPEPLSIVGKLHPDQGD